MDNEKMKPEKKTLLCFFRYKQKIVQNKIT